MKLLNHVVSLFVILIIALIIIPLPASLLDMMFIINISLSLVILLLTMYIKQALDFSVFPSILLITTLFRLALNISSTRLILSHSGEAGQVIKTFGSFCPAGEHCCRLCGVFDYCTCAVFGYHKRCRTYFRSGSKIPLGCYAR
jgi:flagellar biosynthesis protein FlhA